jgi:uncharacterized YccA/Bax inhibitor family protein
VLTRLTPETQAGQQQPYGQPQAGYGYGSPYDTMPAQAPTLPESERMTVDDVVVRTVSLLAITGIAGVAAAYLVTQTPSLLGPIWLGGMIIGLILGMVISFSRVTNPALIITYAVVEGAFLGGVSALFNAIWPGIVIQAIIGTFAIFFVMAGLYKARIIRNSPKFTRGLIGALIAAAAVILLRFILSAFGVSTFLSDGGPVAILISLAIIVIGALTFVLDFDMVEQAVAAGAPKVLAWRCGFGILVGLIWVYLEVLRLLSYFRE